MIFSKIYYKRSRGFMIEEYNLSNEDSEEWPNCSDENRRHLEAARKYLSEKRLDDALEECRKVANCGYAPAYRLKGLVYHRKGNFEKAWEWYLKAAEANDSIGQYYVGCFYEHGLHVKMNPHLAFEYYEKAAGQGLMNAMKSVARCYESGVGCEQNAGKCSEYLRRAEAQRRIMKKMKLDEDVYL